MSLFRAQRKMFGLNAVKRCGIVNWMFFVVLYIHKFLDFAIKG